MSQKMSAGEKAVQRKIERGGRLNSDDRRIVQARLRSVQKRGQYNGATAIPGRTLTKSVGLRANAVQIAVSNTARALNPDKCPIMTALTANVEQCRVSIENGGTGTFSGEFYNDSGLNTKWTVSGSLYMVDCRSQSSGGGVGVQNTGGGTNTTNASGGQSGSGYGLSGGGGAGQNQSVGGSVPVSGATVGVGAGQGVSGGGGIGYSSGESHSGGGSNGLSTSVGTNTSGQMLRETYFAKLKAEYSVTYEAAGGWQSFWGQGSGQQNGECDAGEVQFTVEEAA
ncbi:MAG: hypothetical protein JNJ46_04590 [Myxococcales bacterium]|nr:hypothetical protein [Myxococcales bacterium]